MLFNQYALYRLFQAVLFRIVMPFFILKLQNNNLRKSTKVQRLDIFLINKHIFIPNLFRIYKHLFLI